MKTTAWEVENQLAYAWCKLRPEWSSSFEEAMADIIINGGWEIEGIPPLCRAQIAYTIWTLRSRKDNK